MIISIITLIKRWKTPLLSLRELNVSSFQQTWILFTQGCFVPSLVEIGQVVLERMFKFRQCIFAISQLSPLVKGRVPSLNKFESPSSEDAFCQVWLKLAQWFWRRRFFLILSMYFRYFIIISPWKRAGFFIWTKLNPLHPRMLCAKFGWYWLSGSGEEDY